MALSSKSFFHLVRELVLGFGIAILIPLIAHYVAVIIHPAPPYALHRQEPEQYEAERTEYEKIYFYTTTIIGFVALVIGVFINIASLGVGFVLGGLACLTTGFVTYWGQLHNVLKLISLIAALVLILILTYRFIRRKE